MAEMTFEKAMASLEKIVQELESGDLPLEKALGKFEEGVRLTRLCSKKLDETEKKINILMQDEDGTVRKQEFASKDDLES
ncbi:MAG TPA: exodeoxyribonuclease VII small subunit [Desulfobacterales bacterium]